MLQKGKDVSPIISKAKELVEILAEYPHFRCIGVNSLQLNNAGAYIYQELGYALAWGNEYPEQIEQKQEFLLIWLQRRSNSTSVSSSNYFMEIAKFRAARMLWANIVKAYNPQCECACK